MKFWRKIIPNISNWVIKWNWSTNVQKFYFSKFRNTYNNSGTIAWCLDEVGQIADLPSHPKVSKIGNTYNKKYYYSSPFGFRKYKNLLLQKLTFYKSFPKDVLKKSTNFIELIRHEKLYI